MDLRQGELGRELSCEEYVIREDKLYSGAAKVTLYYSPPLPKLTSEEEDIPLPEAFHELLKTAVLMDIKGTPEPEIEQYVSARVDHIVSGRETPVGISRTLPF